MLPAGETQGAQDLPTTTTAGVGRTWVSLACTSQPQRRSQGTFQFPFPRVREQGVACLGLQDSRVIGGTRMEYTVPGKGDTQM